MTAEEIVAHLEAKVDQRLKSRVHLATSLYSNDRRTILIFELAHHSCTTREKFDGFYTAALLCAYEQRAYLRVYPSECRTRVFLYKLGILYQGGNERTHISSNWPYFLGLNNPGWPILNCRTFKIDHIKST